MPNWRTIRASTDIDPGAWASALLAPDLAAQTLKSEHGRLVRRATILGHEVIIKSAPLDSPLARLKSRLRLSQPHRHYRAAHALRRAGFPAAQPLLLLRIIDAPPVDSLIMEAIAGPTLLEAIADPALPVKHQHTLARAAGDLVLKLTTARFFNRDHKPSNLIISGPQLILIDCVAIRRIPHPALVPRARARMLASLYLEPTGCGHPPRRALIMRTLLAASGNNRSRSRHLWRAAAAIIQRHGDPTPRTNPLAPRQPGR